MTQDPDRRPPSPDGRRDALDDTQPVEVPHFTPAPDPRPDTRWAWAASEPHVPGPAAAPVPRTADAASSAPGQTGWSTPASSATASWPVGGQSAPRSAPGQLHPALSPAGAGPTVAVPWTGPVVRTGTAPRRTSPSIGTVAAVAVLSAVVASSGTVLALDLSGAFREPATVAATGAMGAPPTAAAATPGSSTLTSDDAAVITSSARVSPSVVKITTAGSSANPFGGQDQGVGSGIIYDANGWILTNHHVVAGASSFTVQLKDGRTFAGTVYGIDTLTDLAIVKVDATGLPAASLGSSDALKVGQLVVAVGSPLGTYSFSVTSGIVSGKGRQVTTSDGSTITNLIQTDAAINPGNSGGPLADAGGNVVGINTAIADGSNGIGFAIPIDIAKPIMKQAVRGEKLQRPWIGVYFEVIDQKVKADEHLTVDDGALVINKGIGGGSAILPNSPAAAAGLKDGDVITAINGTALDQEHPLNLMLVQFAPNDSIVLTVIRDGKTMTIPVTLGIRPESVQ